MPNIIEWIAPVAAILLGIAFVWFAGITNTRRPKQLTALWAAMAAYLPILALYGFVAIIRAHHYHPISIVADLVVIGVPLASAVAVALREDKYFISYSIVAALDIAFAAVVVLGRNSVSD